MNRIVLTLAMTFLLLNCRTSLGHGTPIELHADTSLLVSGGASDLQGYAQRLIYESTEEGDPFGSLTLPSVGSVVVWQVPGLQIDGLSTTSNLSIEVLSRPANDVMPVQFRSVWFWNEGTSTVSAAASPLYLLGTNQRFTTIDPTSGTVPPPFLLADPIGGTQAQGGQQGFHNHGLLSYALDNSPVAPAGAYGFFARLVSNEYAASKPFLIMHNNGVEYPAMAEAALAINAAAFLPGDFNHDDRVDAADYVVWRRSAGNTQQYQLWRNNFGAALAAGASGANGGLGAHVPEASCIVLVAGSMLAGMIKRYRVVGP
jgi:hypothetical protein